MRGFSNRMLSRSHQKYACTKLHFFASATDRLGRWIGEISIRVELLWSVFKQLLRWYCSFRYYLYRIDCISWWSSLTAATSCIEFSRKESSKNRSPCEFVLAYSYLWIQNLWHVTRTELTISIYVVLWIFATAYINAVKASRFHYAAYFIRTLTWSFMQWMVCDCDIVKVLRCRNCNRPILPARQRCYLQV